MSLDEKNTNQATKKPIDDSKEELSEAELDKVAGGAMINTGSGWVNPNAPKPKPTS
jgi:hypothetical protein